MSDSPFILVDGSSYLFRAYHALPPLSNSQGEPTGAVVGVINMLRKLIEEYRPDCMAVVFDASGPTFRDELFPEYKANREEAPDDFGPQEQRCLSLLEQMRIPILGEAKTTDEFIAGLE